jgi:signal transduction histidine kinase
MIEIEDAKALDEAVLQSLREIRVGAHKISEIIDELLLLAGARDRDVKIEPMKMIPIAAKARRRVAQQMEDLRGEIHLPETLPAALGYAPWIEEVWVNYLSNALKYGGSPPRIDVGGEVRPDGFVRFWVKDNGAGISPEDQARLFIAFVRLHQGMKRGYGLGLSIVRRIVERCGGQVGVESTGVAGEGSTFWFTLPTDFQK